MFEDGGKKQGGDALAAAQSLLIHVGIVYDALTGQAAQAILRKDRPSIGCRQRRRALAILGVHDLRASLHRTQRERYQLT